MDAVAPGLLVAQAIGRIGNYFNQELFGGPTTLPWGSRSTRPPAGGLCALRHLPADVPLRADLRPALAGALIALGRGRRVRSPGLFALYVAGYSGFRIFEELLRVDPSHRILGLRLNFYVATLVALAGSAWFVRIQLQAPLPWAEARFAAAARYWPPVAHWSSPDAGTATLPAPRTRLRPRAPRSTGSPGHVRRGLLSSSRVSRPRAAGRFTKHRRQGRFSHERFAGPSREAQDRRDGQASLLRVGRTV